MDVAAFGRKVIENVERVIVGKRDVVRLSLVSMLCEGREAEMPNEVAFDFAPDETCWALIRRERAGHHPLLARAAPPYVDWSFVEMPMRLGGPCLWFVGEQAYISGRWYQPGGHVNTAVFRMEGDTPLCEIVLPSGGDTSYMGAAQYPGDATRFWLTYYSSHEYSPTVNSHEYPANIYLCDVRFG